MLRGDAELKAALQLPGRAGQILCLFSQVAGRCGSCAHAQSCSRALTKIAAASGLPQLLQFPLLMCVLEPVGHLQLFVCKHPPAPSRGWARLHKPAMHWEPSPGDAPCILCYQSNKGVTHNPTRVCNQEEKCFNATSPSNKPGTFSMLRDWRFGAFSCISTQAQTCALRKRTCPCRIPALLDDSTPLPGTAAALAPFTRARIQHSREKCKSSYSAFAAQLGLKSPANSPNPA